MGRSRGPLHPSGRKSSRPSWPAIPDENYARMADIKYDNDEQEYFEAEAQRGVGADILQWSGGRRERWQGAANDTVPTKNRPYRGRKRGRNQGGNRRERGRK